jgi:ABC-2 type transport system permease protein
MKIRRIMSMVRKEFIHLFRDRRMYPIIFVAPVMQLILFGYAATMDVKDVKLVVLDRARTQESREVLDKISGSGYFLITASVESEREIDEFLDSNGAMVGMIIPPDFSRNIKRGVSAPIQVHIDGANANHATLVHSYLTQIVGNYSIEILSTKFRNAGISMPQSIDPRTRIWFNPTLESVNYMVPGVLSIVLLLVSVLLSAMAIVKEKERGTIEQLIVTPVRPFEIIIGKLIPFVLIGMIDVTLVMIVATQWFKVPLVGSVLSLYFASAVFILASLGIGLFLSTISRTQQQAMMMAQLIIMPSMLLSGVFYPTENMPIAIQYLSYLIPMRYFITMIRSIFLKGVGVFDQPDQIIPLMVFGVLIFFLAAMRFRKNIE